MNEELKRQLQHMGEVRKATGKHLSRQEIQDMIDSIFLSPDPRMVQGVDFIAQVCCTLAAVELSVLASIRGGILKEDTPPEEREKFFRMALGIKNMELTHLVLGAVGDGNLSRKEAEDLCPYDVHTPEWHIYHQGVGEALGVDGAAEALREYEEHKK